MVLESSCSAESVADPQPSQSVLVQSCCSLSFPLVKPGTTGEKQRLQQMPYLLLCQYLVYFHFSVLSNLQGIPVPASVEF